MRFFDIRVFNPFASSYSQSPLSRCYVTNEQEKRHVYDERVREVERVCFSPLVFSASGGMGPTATRHSLQEVSFYVGRQMGYEL